MAAIAGAAAGIALIDFLSSKGQKLSITDNITTNMSINSTTNVATECFQSLSAIQVIDVEEGPDYNVALMPTACKRCLDYLTSIHTARNALETAAQNANLSYHGQVANPVLETQMTTGGAVSDPTAKVATLGPCTAMCSDIVLINAVQTATLSATQDCEVTNDITTEVSQGITGQISAYLKNQQDIIGQLESAFTSNTESISANLGTAMGQSVTQNFTESLSQAMSAIQEFKMSGNSVVASNIEQSFTGQMIGSLNVNNTVTDQLRQSANYSIAQSLLNKNDTIGDLSNDFLQVINTMSSLLEELTTQILIIVGAVIAAVILVVGALFIFNKGFHSWATNAMQTVADAKIAHFTKMQVDPEYRAMVKQQDVNLIAAKSSAKTTEITAKTQAKVMVKAQDLDAKAQADAQRQARYAAGNETLADRLF